MKSQFELAKGSVCGKDHRKSGRNNQDFCDFASGENIVAVVSDGCGSGPTSEAGSILGVRLAMSAIGRQLADGGSLDLEAVQKAMLGNLHAIIGMVSGSASAFVNDHLLFTLVGAVITPDEATFFAFGDGIVVVNGEEFRLGPFPDNMPPYLIYALARSSMSPELCKFQVIRTLPTAELSSFLIGTDGVDFLAASADKEIPGPGKPVGAISRLWEEDRFFRNSDMLRRHLALVNGFAVRNTSPNAGHLDDDTTIVVGRRKVDNG